MYNFLNLLITALIGTSIIVNGINLNPEDILAKTKVVVNETNLHQLRNALEIYYLDNHYYPITDSSSEMILDLVDAGYLQSVPRNSDIFYYQSLAQGQTYTLSI
jgi:hypothetical protein